MHFFWLCHKINTQCGQRLRSLENSFVFHGTFPPAKISAPIARGHHGCATRVRTLGVATAALHIRTPRGTGSYCLLVTATRVPFQEFGYKSSPAVPLLRNTSNAILPGHKAGVGEQSVELFAFDRAYVERLRDADPATELHFVSYFEQLLRIKLRARALSAHTVEELRQETFIRVIAALRKQGGVRQPERLGAFVNSVCNNVLLEFYRASARSGPLEEHHLEAPGK